LYLSFYHILELMSPAFELRQIPLDDIANLPLPEQLIKTDHDVETWRTTRSYQDYAVFLRRLTESVIGVFLPWSSDSDSPVCRSTSHFLSDN